MTFSDSELSNLLEFDLHAIGLWDNAKLSYFFDIVCFKNATLLHPFLRTAGIVL